MSVFLMLILLLIGLVLIVKGGDLFIDSSVWIARISRIREMIIGATIVSVGTTLPELLTSTIASVNGAVQGDSGYYALALSNAIGSMLANSGLILALVLLIRPPKYEKDTFKNTSIYVLVISVLVTLFIFTNSRISMTEGMLLLVAFFIFTWHNIREAGRETMSSREELIFYERARSESKGRMILSFIVGAISIGVGAMLLVENAKGLAMSLGVSEELLGVTLVAIGTSLPELVTSMTALRHGTTDIGVGNIMGAHVINGTLIIGISTLIARGGVVVDDITRNVGVFVMLAIMVVLIVPAVIRHRFTRGQGAIMLTLYIAFMTYNAVSTLR